MIYLAPASTPRVREAMRAGLLGQMLTYKSGNTLEPGVEWAMDNGVVKLVNGRPQVDPNWSSVKWLRYLLRHRHAASKCLFAVVPDHVGDADRTTEKWRKWAPVVRAMGYRLAYVTQDGCTDAHVPWDEIDCLFNGGSDDWKLGEAARHLTFKARALGIFTHMGRVNSSRRVNKAALDGYDSIDGTYIAFGPDVNLPKVLRWVDQAPRPQITFAWS